jgi:hypothetical protein
MICLVALLLGTQVSVVPLAALGSVLGPAATATRLRVRLLRIEHCGVWVGGWVWGEVRGQVECMSASPSRIV